MKIALIAAAGVIVIFLLLSFIVNKASECNGPANPVDF